MLTIGLVLLIGGILGAAGVGIRAASNFKGAAQSFTKPGGDPFGAVSGAVGKHFGLAKWGALAGACSLIGLVLTVVALVKG